MVGARTLKNVAFEVAYCRVDSKRIDRITSGMIRLAATTQTSTTAERSRRSEVEIKAAIKMTSVRASRIKKPRTRENVTSCILKS